MWRRREVFEVERSTSDVSLWNAIIDCFGKNDEMESAKRLYDEMMAGGQVKADKDTYCTLRRDASSWTSTW